jgi:hypothetical protein
LQRVFVLAFFFFFLLTPAFVLTPAFLAFFFLVTRVVAICVILPAPGTLMAVITLTAVFVIFCVTLTVSNTLTEETGLIDPDAAEPADVPSALVATEEKVYATPLVRPVIVHEPDAPVTVQVLPPGDAVTV